MMKNNSAIGHNTQHRRDSRLSSQGFCKFFSSVAVLSAMKTPGNFLLLLCWTQAIAVYSFQIDLPFLLATNRRFDRYDLVYMTVPSLSRRDVLLSASFFGSNPMGVDSNLKSPQPPKATNQVTKIVSGGMKHRRLGGSDISVSELGLGTQRWLSTDYNAPDEAACFAFMDKAILQHGVNLLDTAEQYPIPSDGGTASEGDTERCIGKWMRDRPIQRSDLVIATKITGGRNVTPKNIEASCEASLQRLGTNYIDVYQLHWPQRYSPQCNWGQSLAYDIESDASSYWRSIGGPTSFEALCTAMESLIQKGKIRGWGLCNDNAYGLTACTRTAKALGMTPPCSLQGDFSLIDRKSEENAVAEAASPYNENVGFMSYNALAGGMLTGKYLDRPAAMDDFIQNQRERGMESLQKPRGRMDTRGWGGTLYRYRTDAAVEAIRSYQQIADKHKMPLTELALRWNRQRSLVTTTLVGHSSMEQLDASIKYFTMNEPLSDDVMWEIDMVHMKNRLPIFSSNRVGRDWNGTGEIGEKIP
jgi:aryl-alcohol dehydrogenase-like predicted oxidoreductase